MQFKIFEKGIDVNGPTVYSIVDGFSLFKSLPSKYLLNVGIGEEGQDGIVKIDPEKWYSQESWLKAFENIANSVGHSTLYKIGLKIPENAIFPPWVQDINSAIQSIDIAYHMNHRKHGKPMFNTDTGEMQEGIGHYGYEKVSDRKIVSVCNNPYPCDFDRGIITAMADKFEKKSLVIHDDSKPCRKKGADSCTYEITW